jgi:hypothetical protein
MLCGDFYSYVEDLFGRTEDGFLRNLRSQDLFVQGAFE